jgi:pyrroline-5-carboxylate reductase
MSNPLSNKRLAILGAGKMGGSLLRAFLNEKLVLPENVAATVRHGERAQALTQELGVRVTTDDRAAARGADVIVLAVKPQTVAEVLDEIRGEVKSDALVVSVAASVPTKLIEQRLPDKVAVVRAMPNTPCVVRSGMTGLSSGSRARPEHVDLARALFDAVGRTVIVDEKHMDAVTGLSASGVAFVYIILESLAEGGVKVGLPREVATLLAAQTMLGAARTVLETGDHPAQLKDGVTTPAGCTIDGIMEMEDGKVRSTLIKAVVKATERAKELISTDSGGADSPGVTERERSATTRAR